jgi:DNA-binding transcriptional regulator YiaG
MYELNSIINGNLLGDGNVRSQNNKYFSYKVTSRDEKFAKWLKNLFNNFGIKSWISKDNENLFSAWFYINTCPYPKFLSLRNLWYKKLNGKTQKIIPRDLQLNSTVLLHWYLGDGSLIRRKNDSDRVPFIVLATNAFSKEDVNFLIQKLKELNLNFYPVKYKSGFTGKESGYCLYSKTQDGTPFRFFKLIGLECPKEIANCSTGRKGIYHEEKFFRDKWPTEEDWIKILSNVKGIGSVIKEKRKQLNISRKELTKLLNVNKDYIRKIESGRRNPSVNKLRTILKTLDLNNLKIS